jgi:D-lactate dehydrogenase (cytochrome)
VDVLNIDRIIRDGSHPPKEGRYDYTIIRSKINNDHFDTIDLTLLDHRRHHFTSLTVGSSIQVAISKTTTKSRDGNDPEAELSFHSLASQQQLALSAGITTSMYRQRSLTAAAASCRRSRVVQVQAPFRSLATATHTTTEAFDSHHAHPHPHPHPHAGSTTARRFFTSVGTPRSRSQSHLLASSPQRMPSTSTSTSTRTFQCSSRRPLSATSSSSTAPTTTNLPHDPYYGALQEKLPHVTFSTNIYERNRHGKGESHHPTAAPDIVATPTSTADIRTIVQHCVQHNIPIIPFGVGTSVEGHVSALFGGLSLDTSLLQSIEIPDVIMSGDGDGDGDGGDDNNNLLPDQMATVGAGVTRKALNQALRYTGMQFSVDPGADATIGGMVATGASGTTAVRYGTMRENILALECVLADAEATVVGGGGPARRRGALVSAPGGRRGTHALKSSAGYDLVSLMCGSEGTLGVITSVTVKLHPIPEHVVAAVCVFESLTDAAQAVAALKLVEIPVTRCELLDASSVQAFNAYSNNGSNQKPMQVKPTLFLEFQGSSQVSLNEQVSMTESICVDDFGGSNFDFHSDEQERQALWSARHSLLYATIALRPGATSAFITDACVPLSQFANLIEATAKDVAEKGLVGPCFGHAGDGNLHCILPLLEDESAEYLEKVHQVNENLIERTLLAGGTCTGEHGVGYGKIQYLERQYGPGATIMMQMIKKGLDPYNIMNPGKVVPS